jgi:hypothetical protein
MRHYPALLVIVLAAGCRSSMLEPGDTLSGHWNNANASLDANQNGVVFVLPCDQAEFGPLVLDSNRAFAADSKVFTEGGNITHFPDDRLHIQGTVTGGTIMLTFYVTRTSGGGSDPINMTLTLGKAQPAQVCTA